MNIKILSPGALDLRDGVVIVRAVSHGGAPLQPVVHRDVKPENVPLEVVTQAMTTPPQAPAAEGDGMLRPAVEAPAAEPTSSAMRLTRRGWVPSP